MQVSQFRSRVRVAAVGAVVAALAAVGGVAAAPGVAGAALEGGSVGCGTFLSGSAIVSAANNEYVSAELGNTGGSYAELRARSGVHGPWEQWQFVVTGDGHFAIRSVANDEYVSAELGNTGSFYAELRARSGVIGPWEKFDVQSTPGGCAIRSVANGLYVSAEVSYLGGDYGMLRARASGIGAWEIFRSDQASSPYDTARAEAAISWMQARSGSRSYDGMCEKAVENAFGTTGRYATAFADWNSRSDKHTDTNPPRGALVFWRTSTAGHVGISLGNGQVISTSSYQYRVNGWGHAIGTSPTIGFFQNYLGWAGNNF